MSLLNPLKTRKNVCCSLSVVGSSGQHQQVHKPSTHHVLRFFMFWLQRAGERVLREIFYCHDLGMRHSDTGFQYLSLDCGELI